MSPFLGLAIGMILTVCAVVASTVLICLVYHSFWPLCIPVIVYILGAIL